MKSGFIFIIILIIRLIIMALLMVNLFLWTTFYHWVPWVVIEGAGSQFVIYIIPVTVAMTFVGVIQPIIDKASRRKILQISIPFIPLLTSLFAFGRGGMRPLLIYGYGLLHLFGLIVYFFQIDWFSNRSRL